MKIILAGFEFESSNKGCEALTYSVMSLLDSIDQIKPLHIVNLNIHKSMGQFEKLYPNIKFTNLPVKIKDRAFWKQFRHEVKDADVALDITHGDSFSDIYGESWFKRTTLIKTYLAFSRIPLILMPQTYGPFNAWWVKLWAKIVLLKSNKVFTRDNISYQCLKRIGIKKNIENTIDLAFSLPYVRETFESDKIRIGFNVSGLLWDDCKKKNRFGLKLDYCQYCNQVLSILAHDSHFEIHLIPHVLCDPREGEDYFENDSKAIREILAEFPNCIFPNYFMNALDAKNYISGLDFLIAPRMHASIAAFSANVPVLPLAYSRKFDGVYTDMNYKHMINAKTMNTEEAISITMYSIQHLEDLKNDEIYGINLINRKSKQFTESLIGAIV